MSVPGWEEMNLWLSPRGIAAVRDRCVGDVDQHVELYRALQSRGYLSRPKLWVPNGSGRIAKYTP
jgi:hypothetical protein